MNDYDQGLVSIDPGGARKGCSGARFDRGVLVRVFPSIDLHSTCFGCVSRVVVERPQMDGRSRAVPPAVLIDLAWQGAMVVGVIRGENQDCECTELTPDQWKGGVRADGRFIGGLSKATHHANMIATDALTTAELETIAREFGRASSSFVIDAVRSALRKEALARGAKHRNGHYSEAREVARLPDVLDAVGLGLFALGRTGKDGKKI